MSLTPMKTIVEEFCGGILQSSLCSVESWLDILALHTMLMVDMPVLQGVRLVDPRKNMDVYPELWDVMVHELAISYGVKDSSGMASIARVVASSRYFVESLASSMLDSVERLRGQLEPVMDTLGAKIEAVASYGAWLTVKRVSRIIPWSEARALMTSGWTLLRQLLGQAYSPMQYKAGRLLLYLVLKGRLPPFELVEAILGALESSWASHLLRETLLEALKRIMEGVEEVREAVELYVREKCDFTSGLVPSCLCARLRLVLDWGIDRVRASTCMVEVGGKAYLIT